MFVQSLLSNTLSQRLLLLNDLLKIKLIDWWICYNNFLIYHSKYSTVVCIALKPGVLEWSWTMWTWPRFYDIHPSNPISLLINFLYLISYQSILLCFCFALSINFYFTPHILMFYFREAFSKVTKSSNCNGTKYKVTKRITVTVHAREVKTEIEGRRDGKWNKREDYKGFLKQQATANLSITRISFLTR